MFGLLDGLFDFNHDGKPNAFERGTELAAVANMMVISQTSLFPIVAFFSGK